MRRRGWSLGLRQIGSGLWGSLELGRWLFVFQIRLMDPAHHKHAALAPVGLFG